MNKINRPDFHSGSKNIVQNDKGNFEVTISFDITSHGHNLGDARNYSVKK